MNRRTLLAALALAGGGCVSRPTPVADPDLVGDGESGTGGNPRTAAPTRGSPANRSDFETEFTRIERCETPGDATVAFDADAVTATGCIRGANGCAVAALEAVLYDEAASALGLVVATREGRDADAACTEAFVALGYEVHLVVDGRVPETVAVVHDGADGRSRVAVADRSE